MCLADIIENDKNSKFVCDSTIFKNIILLNI